MSNLRPTLAWARPMQPFFRGWMTAVLAFIALGTISAVWSNPFFVRMTPVGEWELPAVSVLAVLTGTFAALPNACGLRRATVGGTAGFLGIACPTCNTILMLIFGGEALMIWFDPIRPYITVAGMGLLSFAIWRRWHSARSAKTRI